MISQQTLKLGDVDTSYVVSGEVETLSCHWYDPIIMKPLSDQFFSNLVRMIILINPRETFKLLLI